MEVQQKLTKHLIWSAPIFGTFSFLYHSCLFKYFQSICYITLSVHLCSHMCPYAWMCMQTHTHTHTHTVNNVGKVARFVPTMTSTEFETLIIFPLLPFPLCLWSKLIPPFLVSVPSNRKSHFIFCLPTYFWRISGD